LPHLRRAAFAGLAVWHHLERSARGVSPYVAGSSDIVTTVMRLHAPLLTEAVARLATAFPDEYWYPAADLHVTILGLRGVPEPDLVASIGTVLAGEGPFGATVRGLAMSRETVYARVFVDGERLGHVRRRLADAFGAPVRPLVRNLAHANVARLRSPDVARLSHRIADHHGSDFGAVSFTSVLLARTDKVFSAAGTTVLAEVALT
jgi:hypothetical protein